MTIKIAGVVEPIVRCFDEFVASLISVLRCTRCFAVIGPLLRSLQRSVLWFGTIRVAVFLMYFFWKSKIVNTSLNIVARALETRAK